MTEGALADLKVLDLGQGVSGPYCGCLFAGCGAEVVKVEPPGLGDLARRMGPFLNDKPNLERSGLFLYMNSGKKSITLDITTRGGADILKELVKDTDVLVENFLPGTMAGFGLDYAGLEKVNPRLVMVSITPFGQTGPYSRFKATELTVFAMGGMMSITGEPDREPIKSGGFQAQYQGALHGFAAASAVAYASITTGVGQHVDISMMEVMASSLESTLSSTSYLGDEHNRHRGGNRFVKVQGVYPCKDGFIGMHANAREWPKIAEGIGMPELLDDPRFSTSLARREHADILEALIMSWTTDRTKQEVYDTAGKLRVPFAPVVNTGELEESPQLTAREFFVEVEHPETGILTYPGAPFKMTETPWQLGRAPLLGEHNEEIYCGRLGYSGEDLIRLRGEGVI